MTGNNVDLEVETRDAFGNTATSDNATVITFGPTLSGTITAVPTGTGDGGYGTVGGAENVTVLNGVARITLTDTVAETFEVSFTSALVDPSNDVIVVSPNAPDEVAVRTAPAANIVAGGTTTLTVEILDATGNFISTDNATVVTFTPSLSGTISDVPTGTGDGSYGVPGGAENVTVVNGVATVTLTDTVVEAFTVAIASGLTTNPPAAGPVTVSHATPSQVVITLAGADFFDGQ